MSGEACDTLTYLDNASTTKPRPEVVRIMQKVLEEDFGNASALHALGRRSHAREPRDNCGGSFCLS